MRRIAFSGIGALAVVLGVVACSAGGASSREADASMPNDASLVRAEGGIDASATTDAGSSGDVNACPLSPTDDAATCNLVELYGSPIVPTCIGSEPPGGRGGPVEYGTYVLDSIVLYGSQCPPLAAETGRATWAICGNQWESVNAFPAIGVDAADYVERVNVTATLSGTGLTLDILCPPSTAPNMPMYQYTATPGHLSLIYPSGYASTTFYEEDDFVLQ